MHKFPGPFQALQTVYATDRIFEDCYIVYLNKGKYFIQCLLSFLTITAKLVHVANLGAVSSQLYSAMTKGNDELC
jgi:hypothetical protein